MVKLENELSENHVRFSSQLTAWSDELSDEIKRMDKLRKAEKETVLSQEKSCSQMRSDMEKVPRSVIRRLVFDC